MLEITKSLLLTFGVGNVITAQNGEIALRRFEQYNPDIVIADWMMTPMDGIQMTRHMRNSSHTPNPYVPIILMTGFSEKRRVLEARDAGVTEFLVKPFTAQDLYRRITQVIERPRQFVRSEDFFGPDRRRRKLDDYVGPRRRETDPVADTLPPGEAELQKQQQTARETLERIRERAGLDKSDPIDLDKTGKSIAPRKGKAS